MLGGKFFAALDRRHDFLGIGVSDAADDFAQVRRGIYFKVEPQLGLAGGSVRAVALVAVGGEDGAHVAVERNGRSQQGAGEGEEGDPFRDFHAASVDGTAEAVTFFGCRFLALSHLGR